MWTCMRLGRQETARPTRAHLTDSFSRPSLIEASLTPVVVFHIVFRLFGCLRPYILACLRSGAGLWNQVVAAGLEHRAHVVTARFLAQAGPLRQHVLDFVSGTPLSETPGLRVEVAKLFLVPVAERTIEGTHAATAHELRRSPNLSASAVSLRRRMPEVEQVLAAPEARMLFSTWCEIAYHPLRLAQCLGIQGHPHIQTAFASLSSVEERTLLGPTFKHFVPVRDAIYHVDLYAQYLDLLGAFTLDVIPNPHERHITPAPEHRAAHSEGEDTGAAERAGAGSTATLVHGASSPADTYDVLLRKAAVCMVRDLCSSGMFFSLPREGEGVSEHATLEDLIARRPPSDCMAARGFEEDDGDLGGQALAGTSSGIEEVASDLVDVRCAHTFFRFVATRLLHKKNVKCDLPMDLSLDDFAVTRHQVMAMHRQQNTVDVSLDPAPAHLESQASSLLLLSTRNIQNIHFWLRVDDKIGYHLPPSLQIENRAEVERVIQMLGHAGAFPSSVLFFEPVQGADYDLSAVSGALAALIDLGMVSAIGSGFQFTDAGVDQLRLSVPLHRPYRPLAVPMGAVSSDWSLYQCLAAAKKLGWRCDFWACWEIRGRVPARRHVSDLGPIRAHASQDSGSQVCCFHGCVMYPMCICTMRSCDSGLARSLPGDPITRR